MFVTIIQGLWKEGSKKCFYYEGVCGHKVVKGRQQKKNYYEGDCGHMAFWNFR